jgi:hypothetical protein
MVYTPLAVIIPIQSSHPIPFIKVTLKVVKMRAPKTAPNKNQTCMASFKQKKDGIAR